MKGRSVTRSEKNKAEHAQGKIRALEKRLKIAERENARLLKFINTHEFELSGEDTEVSEKSSKKRTCQQSGCKSTEFFLFELPSKTGIKRFFTCKTCGKREKESVERSVDTRGK